MTTLGESMAVTGPRSISEVRGALRRDFARSENAQSKMLLAVIRLWRYVNTAKLNFLVRIPLRLMIGFLYLSYVKLLHNCDVSSHAVIGPGLRLVHPYDIVIADGVEIGEDCKILHEVTLGYAERGGVVGVPKIGNGVDMNVGSRIIGPIVVGDNVKVGANAVVYTDVPSDSVVLNKVEIRTP